MRKLYYNITITAMSIAVALLIGGVEMLQVIRQEANAQGAFWNAVQNIPLDNLGFYIVGIFLASWLISVVVYKVRRIDELDASPPAFATVAPHARSPRSVSPLPESA